MFEHFKNDLEFGEKIENDEAEAKRKGHQKTKEDLDEQVLQKQSVALQRYLEGQVPQLTIIGPAANADDDFTKELKKLKKQKVKEELF